MNCLSFYPPLGRESNSFGVSEYLEPIDRDVVDAEKQLRV
jgi:hypothetical protein